MLDYINLRYKPSKNDLIAEFYLEPHGVAFETAASHVALESSIGTWTDIATLTPRIAARLKPSVFQLDKRRRIIRIAYPPELFEPGNIPQLLSGIAGNIFGMSVVDNLRLLDISFPKDYVASFPGPAFGIAGIRKLTGIRDRPLVGTIIKPKLGLNEREHAKVAAEAWRGGLDIVKDDENLTSMKFNQFNRRITETLRLLKQVEHETGETKVYMPNVTAEATEMLKRARFVKEQGGTYVMVDVISAGWSAVQTLRNADLGMVIHAHRAGHAAFTRSEQHGISMLTLAKIARLVGVDQLHIGAIVGKMSGGATEVRQIGEEIEQKLIPGKGMRALEQNWHQLKPTMAVCSGGLHPGSIPKLMGIMGRDIVMQFGGGCHGHPEGTRAGAVAIRQALDAAMLGIPLRQYAKAKPELKAALDTFRLTP